MQPSHYTQYSPAYVAQLAQPEQTSYYNYHEVVSLLVSEYSLQC